MDRQIQIALEAMVAHGGTATTQQIYEAVTRNLPDGLVLSQQGQASLRTFVNRNAVDEGWAEQAQPGWRITPKGRAYLEEVEPAIGTETEDTLADELPSVSTDTEEGSPPPIPPDPVFKPFDPTSIRVEQRMMSIFQVMRKVESRDIDIRPDFQRNFVWNSVRQSRLIESILLRIPLPAFYLDATLDDKWLVVDGLQRLTTLDRFFNKRDLPLTNLEFFAELEGKRFDELPRNLQRQIEDTELNLYVIRPETPPEVKFTVFSRVNTGGLVLTPQEIRHALFQGRATSFLAELAQLDEFIKATEGSISSLRMDDRECALRFAAFYMTSYETYGRTDIRTKSGRSLQQNLDGFLSEAMERINRADEALLARQKEGFSESNEACRDGFRRYAFRKMYKRDGRRTQISKPLFEVWSVLLQSYSFEALERSKEAIVDGFIELMNQVEFNKSISWARAVPARCTRGFVRSTSC
ncbi:MAG: DUF262 domain-containing protein [Polyangiaceae bacterium]|nr:DUF262 domain-containing protein [Polyangiaceae bacterium]